VDALHVCYRDTARTGQSAAAKVRSDERIGKCRGDHYQATPANARSMSAVLDALYASYSFSEVTHERP
jgi:hypothetical protein